MSDILSRAKGIEDYIIAFMREMHENPELSGQEVRTQARIIEELEKIGVDYKKAGRTSVVAWIKGNKPGKTVVLRADIDALPMQEESDVDFKSNVDGRMHACGHDAHASMLMGAVKLLSEMKDQIKGEVRFFFQEAEETFEGAKRIIAEGWMKGVDACFGIHNYPEIEVGKLAINKGYIQAGCDTIYVKFEGVSGHGSTPHLANDTIHPAAMFVTDIQGIITKNVDAQEPIVVSVGKFNGGTKANIIAKYTELDISMRSFEREARARVHEAIKRHAKAIADAYEIKVDVNIEESALSVYNDEVLADVAIGSSFELFGEDRVVELNKLMASEDMSFYLEYAKGVTAWLGSKNVEKGCIYPPHHEKFKVDEDFLKYGAALHSQFAVNFLNQE
ncbi:M20 metallopeptidase family protein [Metaclostridioides mangenotii]|uniref:Amidohydrolase n=1 Tax=Metaclostridioides mangenotii TaxID=1540 RepID=A0ABS4EDW8_9FIRM|nr:amidohydrolase [Clostridioides mangenotii]MBP1856127.1 amidohydrolase [Clostridioides mangenotii]